MVEKEGFFEPEFGEDGKAKKAGYFFIPEPPPNVQVLCIWVTRYPTRYKIL